MHTLGWRLQLAIAATAESKEAKLIGRHHSCHVVTTQCVHVNPTKTNIHTIYIQHTKTAKTRCIHEGVCSTSLVCVAPDTKVAASHSNMMTPFNYTI